MEIVKPVAIAVVFLAIAWSIANDLRAIAKFEKQCEAESGIALRTDVEMLCFRRSDVLFSKER